MVGRLLPFGKVTFPGVLRYTAHEFQFVSRKKKARPFQADHAVWRIDCIVLMEALPRPRRGDVLGTGNVPVPFMLLATNFSWQADGVSLAKCGCCKVGCWALPHFWVTL